MAQHGKIVWPVNFEGEGIILEEDTGGGFVEVYNDVIPAGSLGFYYAFDRSFGVGISILKHLETEFTTASATNTYEFVAVGSNIYGRDDYRLILRAAGGNDFRIKRKTAGDQIIKWLGGSADSDTLTDTAGDITFPDHYNGCWMPPKFWQFHDRREHPAQRIDSVVTNDNRVFGSVRNRDYNRLLHFLVCDGGITFLPRRLQGSWRARNGITQTDDFVSFEYFWTEVIKTGQYFWFFYDVDHTSLGSASLGYVRCRVIEETARKDMYSMLEGRLGDMGVETYDISIFAVQLEQKDVA